MDDNLQPFCDGIAIQTIPEYMKFRPDGENLLKAVQHTWKIEQFLHRDLMHSYPVQHPSIATKVPISSTDISRNYTLIYFGRFQLKLTCNGKAVSACLWKNGFRRA